MASRLSFAMDEKETAYLPTLHAGDRIRMSVALLRDLYDMPNHESVVIEFRGVRFADDGYKIAIFGKVDE